MDLINLIIRIIAFGISLIVLLEFIIVCDVQTSHALIGLVVSIAIFLAGFFILNRHRVKICNNCRHIMHA